MNDRAASDFAATRARSRQELAALFGGLASALLAAIIIATLYIGRDLFIPLAMAILLSFALAPLVSWLERRRLPRGLAVVSVVFLAFASLLALGGLLTKQVADLAGELPRYERSLREKIQSLRGAAEGGGSLERAAEMLEGLDAELNGKGTPPETPAPPPDESMPTPGAGGTGALLADSQAPEEPALLVEVREPESGVIERLFGLISPLVEPLVTGFILLIFVIFILLQREDLRNRLIRLAGSHDIPRTTAALDDAATRVSHLFLLQLLINGAFGLFIGLGLWLIGMPNALLWGVLGTVLRFLPFVGFILAGIIPVGLALVIDPGWELLLWTLGLYIVAESVVSHVIEPIAYGRGTGLSPVAVVISAAFWALLWGPVGLVLATPLTVCLVVIGRHVERLQFLDILFGDQPVLSPPQLFYQRMLAGDPMEAASEAESFLKEKPLASYYDEVAIAGLKLAQEDLVLGSLDESRLTTIRDTVLELTGDLLWHEPLAPGDPAVVASGLPLMPPEARSKDDGAGAGAEVALCLGGRSLLDESAALMLAQVLERQGLSARVQGPDQLSFLRVEELEAQRPRIVCLCYLDVERPTHLRYTVRRLRRRLPGVTLLLGCWPSSGATLDTVGMKTQSGADGVAETLQELARQCLLAAGAVEVAVPEAEAAAEVEVALTPATA
jgi:predicted PurR-regulated permease PerM